MLRWYWYLSGSVYVKQTRLLHSHEDEDYEAARIAAELPEPSEQGRRLEKAALSHPAHATRTIQSPVTSHDPRSPDHCRCGCRRRAAQCGPRRAAAMMIGPSRTWLLRLV